MTTYTYGPFARLASAGGATFEISAEDQRLRKAFGGNVTYFVPGAGGALLAEHVNGTWKDYVWLNGRPVALVANGTVYSVHADQTGRAMALTAPNQSVAWAARNDPFDRSTVTGSAALFPLGFPGQYLDAEDNLWHNGFRDYDAKTGRYIQSDPIGLGGGVNTYVYVRGNPLNNIDPSGLICISDATARVIGAIAGGAVTGALTGAANGKGNPWAILGGLVSGAAISGGTQALSNSLSSSNPSANSSAASGFSNFMGSLVQDRGNAGAAIASGLIAYAGAETGTGAGIVPQMGGQLVTYVGAATIANRGLGAGSLVAGPMFGVAGAYTHLATEAAAKSYNDCDCD